MLCFEWGQVESVLEELAASQAQRMRVRPMVAGLMKLAASMDRVELLMHVLAAAWLIQNEDGELVIEEAQRIYRSQ